mgnify:FL=1
MRNGGVMAKKRGVPERPRNPYHIRKRSHVIPDKREKDKRNRHLHDLWMAKKLNQEIKKEEENEDI